MKKKRPTSQPRLEGACRIPQGTALEARIMHRVAREAARYNVSRSFVVAVALADALGIELDTEYRYR